MKTEYTVPPRDNTIPNVGDSITFYGTEILMRVSHKAFEMFPQLAAKDKCFVVVSLTTGQFTYVANDSKFVLVEPIDGIIKFKSCN